MTKLGVDISHNNGTVDFSALKNAGFGDFAILRAGYGGDYSNQDDGQFVRNIGECERLGIPYGIYLYSYALNTNDAKSEANHVLRLLKQVGSNFKYGVWFDMEDADGYKKKHGMPSNSTLVDICYTFCETVEGKGYYTGIYASLSWLNNQLSGNKLERFDKWVAQWNNTGCTYNKTYSIWQYTSDLNIGGKRFDANELKRDFATSGNSGHVTKPSTNNNKKLYLPKDAKTWRVYPLNKKPIKGNECGLLKPSKFGGLEYDIIRYSQTDVAVIQTRDFGQVQIYVAKSTGAVIK